MNRLYINVLSVVLASVFVGCAAFYKPIDPPSLVYSAQSENDGLSCAYKYDVLRLAGNKKYARKETRRGVRVLALKFTNNTGKTLNVRNDLTFYIGQNAVLPMPPATVKESIKQNVPIYLLYLLLTSSELSVSNGFSAEAYPIGLALGPLVAGGNMIVAGTSNRELLDELMQYDILNRDIQPGETVYGLVGFFYPSYDPLSVRMKQE